MFDSDLCLRNINIFWKRILHAKFQKLITGGRVDKNKSCAFSEIISVYSYD